MSRDTLRALFVVVSVLLSFHSFYVVASELTRRYSIKEIERGVERTYREMEKITELSRERVFMITTIYGQKATLLRLAMLHVERIPTAGEAKSTLKQVASLRHSEKELARYSSELDKHRNERKEMMARIERLRKFNMYDLLSPFISLISLLLGLWVLTLHLDRLRPNRHFRYPAQFEFGRKRRYNRFLRAIRFVQYSILVITSFGTSDIRPVSPLARTIACVASIIGIVYILGIIAAMVSIVIS